MKGIKGYGKFRDENWTHDLLIIRLKIMPFRPNLFLKIEKLNLLKSSTWKTEFSLILVGLIWADSVVPVYCDPYFYSFPIWIFYFHGTKKSSKLNVKQIDRNKIK